MTEVTKNKDYTKEQWLYPDKQLKDYSTTRGHLGGRMVRREECFKEVGRGKRVCFCQILCQRSLEYYHPNKQVINSVPRMKESVGMHSENSVGVCKCVYGKRPMKNSNNMTVSGGQ